jgi:hypothetical protein
MGRRRSPREERAYREEQRRKAIARERKAELQVEQQRVRLEQQQLRLEEQPRLAAQRQAARVERERKALHERQRVAERDAHNGELQRRVTELETLLSSSLAIAPGTGFAELKRTVDLPPLDPGEDAQPLPIPPWEAFAPAQPSAVGRLFGGAGRLDDETIAFFTDYWGAVAPDGPDHFPVVKAKLDRMHREEPTLTVADLAGYPGPALVMVGDSDEEIPIDHTLALHRGLPNAQLAVLPGTGHGGIDTRIVIKFLTERAEDP